MRITGGEYRGRVLRTLSGSAVRPTSDKVRQGLFNILGERIPETRMLDIFAGSGSVGLEALSRGAAHVTFVEKDHRSLKVIHENIESLGVHDRATTRRLDFVRHPEALRDPAGAFDIVFLDPPYRMAEHVDNGSRLGELLDVLWSEGIVDRSGLVILEHGKRSYVADEWKRFEISSARTYGDTVLTFMSGRSADV